MPAYFDDPAALASVAPAPDAWLLPARTPAGARWLRPRYAAGAAVVACGEAHAANLGDGTPRREGAR